ncbi:MAG: UDP binding domain-containing protein, partial [Pseudomonadota bacterium]
GNIAKAAGIDSHDVMKIFFEDTKLNLSSYYLKPGFAFGGSCLPKDVRALTYEARRMDLDLPLLSSIMPSNQRQIQRAVEMVQRKQCRRIGILGFSFKAGTDDLRESPVVALIESLIGKGFDISIYDQNVNLAKLMGSNREYILEQIPHISRLMVDTMEEVVEHAQLLVIGNKAKEFEEFLSCVPEGVMVLDLVRISEEVQDRENYDGVCW